MLHTPTVTGFTGATVCRFTTDDDLDAVAIAHVKTEHDTDVTHIDVYTACGRTLTLVGAITVPTSYAGPYNMSQISRVAAGFLSAF